VTTSDDRTARIWEAATGTGKATVEGHSDQFISAYFSPDGRRVVTTNWDRSVRIWDSRSGKPLSVFQARGLNALGDEWQAMLSPEFGASWSPDGRWVVAPFRAPNLRVWDAQSGRVVGDLEGNPTFVRRACFMPDGRRVVMENHGTPRITSIVDAQTGSRLKHFDGRLASSWKATAGPMSGSVSSDGTRILTLDEEKKLFLSRRRRPEWWWGVAWLPEFWLTLAFGIASAVSLRDDRRLFRQACGQEQREGGS
jgi:WD40 repeat protein